MVQRDFTPREVLLIANIAICRDQHFKTRGFSSRQKLAVFEFFPTTGAGFPDSVTAY
jgi:hypothetical protein